MPCGTIESRESGLRNGCRVAERDLAESLKTMPAAPPVVPTTVLRTWVRWPWAETRGCVGVAGPEGRYTMEAWEGKVATPHTGRVRSQHGRRPEVHLISPRADAQGGHT